MPRNVDQFALRVDLSVRVQGREFRRDPLVGCAFVVNSFLAQHSLRVAQTESFAHERRKFSPSMFGAPKGESLLGVGETLEVRGVSRRTRSLSRTDFENLGKALELELRSHITTTGSRSEEPSGKLTFLHVACNLMPDHGHRLFISFRFGGFWSNYRDEIARVIESRGFIPMFLTHAENIEAEIRRNMSMASALIQICPLKPEMDRDVAFQTNWLDVEYQMAIDRGLPVKRLVQTGVGVDFGFWRDSLRIGLSQDTLVFQQPADLLKAQLPDALTFLQAQLDKRI